MQGGQVFRDQEGRRGCRVVFRDQEGWKGSRVGRCSETRRGGEGAGWAGVQRLVERVQGWQVFRDRCSETRRDGEGARWAGVQRPGGVEREHGRQVFRDQEGLRGSMVDRCSETRRGGEGARWAGV